MKNVQIITGANYWVDFFSTQINHKNKVSYYPNLFDTILYKSFVTTNKRKQIHLGQWHTKNAAALFDLAKKLNDEGYHCYFSCNDISSIKKEKYYEIKHFASFNEYLQAMAESIYTIALTQINEGWNRVAHESILVGTSVIGFNKAGLGELLKTSNSFIVNNANEAFEIIKQNKHNNTPETFIQKHDVCMSEGYLEKIEKL